MSDIQSNLAFNMKSARRELGWTQANLAEAVDLSVPTIQRIEAEIAWPEVDNLRAIAKALKRTPSELLDDPHSKEVLDHLRLDLITSLLEADRLDLDSVKAVLRKSRKRERPGK
jgi:transcriptional regulator with XRE-family HTH domain